jgi:hypothetical protein
MAKEVYDKSVVKADRTQAGLRATETRRDEEQFAIQCMAAIGAA